MSLPLRWLGVVFALSVGVNSAGTTAAQEKKVSEFGKYQGYGQVKYKKWIVQSRYLKMRDGVKLAMDVIRPSVAGKAAKERLPALWTHSRYHRCPPIKSAGIKSVVDASSDLQRLVRHGYVIVTVAVRGSGASFGRYEGLFSPNETKDANEIIQWIAKQPWCTGKVGMFGGSYLGITQYMAASQKPPALKAIFPDVAAFDMYDVIYPGGIYREDMIQHWGKFTRILDTKLPPRRVQSDKGGALLRKAIAEHAKNWDVLVEYRKARFRNTRSPQHSYMTHNPAPFLKAINAAKVPAYHFNGFYDIFVKDAVLWYANYKGPQRLGIGPWPHSVAAGRPYMAERMRVKSVEQHRWFDYWLKGIENGVTRGAPINYALTIHPNKWKWMSARRWPPAGVKPHKYYFTAGPAGAVRSTNDGSLARKQPAKKQAADSYKIDPGTTTGTSTRWDNAVGAGPMKYGDMTSNDGKCLTYTSPPLKQDVTIVGHPVATLFLECSANDCDVFVLLQEVDNKGASHYVTEGVLRASHRKLAKAPWNNLGLPHHRSFKEDKTPLRKGVPAVLKFDLHPTATVFNKGHRIRVTIMCADKDNAEQPSAKEATIRLHRNARLSSHVILPILK